MFRHVTQNPMNSSSEAKLRQIERASFVLRALCTALYIPVAVVTLAATVSILAGWTAHISYHGQTFVPSELALSSRLILAAVGLITAAVLIKALHHLRRLACNYMRREIFTADSARQIRQFGIACMLWGVVKLGWTLLPLLIPAQRLTVYSTSLDPILIGAVIVGISWIAEMAAALREENDLTV
jgi:hypothetical protein